MNEWMNEYVYSSNNKTMNNEREQGNIKNLPWS